MSSEFHDHLDIVWPGPTHKERLSARADRLLIWVALAYTYIKKSIYTDQALDALLYGRASNTQRGPETALDGLYLGILGRTKVLHDSTDATKYVVGSILVAKIPLTRPGLDSLLGLSQCVTRALGDGSEVRLTSSAPLISALGSILRVDDEGTIRVLHTSIKDFFTNPNRCVDERFFIDRSKYNRELTMRCFETMHHLKRDVCAINDPTKFNSEISDLQERLNKYLTEPLRYACVYWHRHLEDIKDDDHEIWDQVKRFMLTHLLHWIEVMSLLNDTNSVFVVLNDLKHWFQVGPICS